MRSMKLAVVLPTFQFMVAAILLLPQYRTAATFHVTTDRLICLGLNAPALFFRLLDPIGWGPAFWGLPRSILGYDTDDCFFLMGVIVVWYLVGRALDHRRTSEVARRPRLVVVLTAYPFLLALGGLLFVLGVAGFQEPQFSNFGHRPEREILTLMWSVSLIFFSVRGIVKAIVYGSAAKQTAAIPT